MLKTCFSMPVDNEQMFMNRKKVTNLKPQKRILLKMKSKLILRKKKNPDLKILKL